MKFISFVFIFSLLYFSFPSKAQVLAIRNYNIADGMPDANVKSMVQDAWGYIWIATEGGLSRFNGKKFENFTTEHGLFSNNIAMVIVDSKKNIWAATRAGLSKWEGKKFKTYTIEDGLVNDDVHSILEDTKGNLWIGTAAGLSVYDGKTFKNYTKKDGLTPSTIWSMAFDNKQNLYLATSDGLGFFDGKSFYTYTTKDGLPTDALNHIWLNIKDNVLWIATANGLSYLYNEKFTTFSKKDGLPSSNIWNIAPKDSENLWIATSGGVVVWNIAQNALSEIITKDNGLLDDEILEIMEDNTGDVWFGTDEGLSKLSNRFFELYTSEELDVKSSIWSLCADSNNNIWMGTAGDGLIRYNGKNYKTFKISDGLPDNFVRNLFEDSKGNLWIGTFEGLARYNGANFKTFNTKDGLADNSVYAISEDAYGNIWIGTDKGLSKFDGKDFESYTEKDGLASNYIRASYIDKKNKKLYFGTYKGVTIYKDGKFTNYNTKNGLAHNLVLAIYEDTKNNIWFATENGLCKINPEADPKSKDCFTCYGKKDGMASQNVWLLTEDDQGYLWVGHRTGLERFDLKDKKFQSFSYIDGLRLMQTFPNAVTKDKNGNLWFGALGGVIKYSTKNHKANTIAPLVHITAVDVNQKAIDWSTRAKQTDFYFQIPSASKPGRSAIKLAYNEDKVTIHYAGLHFSVPEKVRYRYKLEGVDTKWSELTDKDFANYTNLKPGRYKFLVKAYNNDGLECKTPAEFIFDVDTPYWQKWWFYLLQLAIFVALIGLSIYFNTTLSDSRVTVILTFITLLVFFEFFNVHIESYLDDYIENVPLYKTFINVMVAVMFTPLEGYFHKYINRVRSTKLDTEDVKH